MIPLFSFMRTRKAAPAPRQLSPEAQAKIDRINDLDRRIREVEALFDKDPGAAVDAFQKIIAEGRREGFIK